MRHALALPLTLILTGSVVVGCKSTTAFHNEADRVASKIIDEKQQVALGRTEPFTIETPEDTLRRKLIIEQHLPISGPASLGSEHIERLEKHYPKDAPGGVEIPPAPAEVAPAIQISLIDALQIAAHNSRDYQTQKESVYLTALSLDLERDEFRSTFTGLLNSEIIRDLSGDEVTGVVTGGSFGASQRLKSGVLLSARIGVDLVKLLTGDRESGYGLLTDASVTIPLLRGAGEYIVAEPLTQAERDIIYSIWEFENYKRDFAINIASQYFAVLEQLDSVQNAESNYKRLISNTELTRAQAEAGRIQPLQVDQAINNELRARERWISARENYARRLDQLKVLLGLPPDANIALDRTDLEHLNELAIDALADLQKLPSATTLPEDAPDQLLETASVAQVAPYLIPVDVAVGIALENRLDLRTAKGEIYDAQRRVRVAANAFLPDLALTGDAVAGGGRGSLNSASADDVRIELDQGLYSAGVQLELPLERTAERNAYRQSLITLQRAVRQMQEVEDNIKLDVRNTLRDLMVAREGVQTQAEQVKVAERRRDRANELFAVGRTEVRDVLEAEDALITAQNSFTSALVEYRLGLLRLQRDLGVLEVNEQGLWREAALPLRSANAG